MRCQADSSAGTGPLLNQWWFSLGHQLQPGEWRMFPGQASNNEDQAMKLLGGRVAAVCQVHECVGHSTGTLDSGPRKGWFIPSST